MKISVKNWFYSAMNWYYICCKLVQIRLLKLERYWALLAHVDLINKCFIISTVHWAITFTTHGEGWKLYILKMSRNNTSYKLNAFYSTPPFCKPSEFVDIIWDLVVSLLHCWFHSSPGNSNILLTTFLQSFIQTMKRNIVVNLSLSSV